MQLVEIMSFPVYTKLVTVSGLCDRPVESNSLKKTVATD